MGILRWFWGVSFTGWEGPVPPGAVVGSGGQTPDDKEFEMDVVRDWELVEVMKDGSDVVVETGVCEECVCVCRILDIL